MYCEGLPEGDDVSGEIKIGTLVQCLGGTPNLAHRKFAGTIHVVRELAHIYLGKSAYYLDPPTTVPGFVNSRGRPFELSWTREYLRILDNPSKDAVDETLEWIPVPTTDEVTT